MRSWDLLFGPQMREMVVSQRDPFESYRRKREIELMERQFQARANAQRKHLEDILKNDEDDPEETERKVDAEMQEFLSQSAESAERMIENIYDDDDDAGETQKRLKSQIEDFFSGFGSHQQEEAPREAPPEPARSERQAQPERRAESERRAQPERGAPQEDPPRPSVVECRPLGGVESEPAKPLDLSAALDRIRNHVKNPEDAPPVLTRNAEPKPRTREEAAEEVRDFGQAPGAPSSPPPQEALAGRVQPLPPASGEDGGNGDGGMPGVTNVFHSEQDEDRDIDDGVNPDEPAGWDIPTRPPPPGAWVVAKHKEEGAAGLAGAAGDTYLIKKLCQEVKSLNRMYLALLEKGVVTREEVEGGGDSPPPPRRRSDDDEDDDAVSIDDFADDRYRPIDITDKDFSLSGLVKDVHRLKSLREVLMKKGIVSEKEIAKAKG